MPEARLARRVGDAAGSGFDFAAIAGAALRIGFAMEHHVLDRATGEQHEGKLQNHDATPTVPVGVTTTS